MATLQTEIERVLAPARAIADKAKREAREFTAEESTQVTKAIDQARALKAKAPSTDAELRELLKSVPFVAGTGGKAGGLGSAGTWGKAVSDHLASFGAKALTPSGTVIAPPAWSSEVADMGERPRFLTDVIPAETIEGSEFSFWRQTVRTSNAAPVAAGALKPTSVFTVERVADTVKVVAHLSEAIPRQDVADSESLTEFVEAELRLGYRVAVDSQIVTGDGLGENFTGLANLTGVQTQAKGTDSNQVAARKALTLVQLADEVPSHWVMHPSDLQLFDLAVDNEQRYFFGGPTEAGPVTLWGIPIIPTRAVPAGTAYLGPFTSQARLYQREEVRVDWSENTADDFARNQVRFRAEGRVNVAWLRPFSFVALTGVAA